MMNGIRRKTSSLFLSVLMTLSALLVLVGPASADTGLGDTYGYNWTDSNAPTPTVAFNWIDITSSGTDSGVTGDDSYTAAIPIGFDFEFYGNTYSSLYFSTNGLVTFGAGSSDYSHDYIPYSAAPNNLIAAFWADLCVDYNSYNAGAIYYETIGVSPNQQFVIEWSEISRLGSYDLMTFEVVLFETGEIMIQFLEMSGETGSYATVGIEDSAGVYGCEYSYNEDTVSDSLAVLFELGPIGFGPPVMSIDTYPGSGAGYFLTLFNHQAGTDTFNIEPVSERGWTFEIYDETLTPLVDTSADGIPDTGPVASGDSVSFYVAVIVPSLPTHWSDNTTVTATSASAPSVSESVLLVTEVFRAEFGDGHSDSVTDLDADSRYDILTVNLDITVLFSDTFYVEWTSEGPSGGSLVSGYGYYDLAPGADSVSFDIPGDLIWSQKTDGSCLVYMYIYDSDGTFLDFDSYYTMSRGYDEFERPPAYISGPVTDYALDTDLDSLYDLLVFQVPVEVESPVGVYLYGELYDASDTVYLMWSETTAELEVGSHVLEVQYRGWLLYQMGISGPYTAHLSMYDLDTWDYYDGTVAVSGTYQYDDFDDVAAWFSGLPTDAGLDPDTDGDIDEMVVYVPVEASLPWEYMVNYDLYEQSGMTYLGSGGVETFLPSGYNVVELSIPGLLMSAYGYDGPYYLDLYLYDTDWNYLDLGSHVTDAYMVSDFESEGGVLVPPFADFVSDWDWDGKYDMLAVDVAELVAEEFGAFIEGILYDQAANEIARSSSYIWLWPGYNYFTFWFDGLDIRLNGADGPYTVEVYLYDDGMNLLDSETHVTAAYLWDDFEEPRAGFSPPHEEWAVDSDADLLYDHIQFNVSLEVYEDSWFYVNAEMYDSYDNMISSYNTYEYSDAGEHTTVIYINGWDIGANNVDGPYRLELELRSDSWGLMDSDTHMTQEYSRLDFEGPAVRWGTPITDHGEDIDLDGLYDEIVVEATVEVLAAGTYYFYGDLYHPGTGEYIYSSSADGMFDVGTYVIELRFPAEMISVYGVDISWLVELRVYDAWWSTLDVNDYYTQVYAVGSLERPDAYFGPIDEVYDLDSDADGLIEYLVVNATVNVTVAGYYYLEGTFYLDMSRVTSIEDATVYLDVGDMQTVPLAFETWRLWMEGSDGPHSIGFQLYTIGGSFLDSMWVETDMFPSGDMDPTFPVLDSTYVNTPPVIDGTYSPGEWAQAVVVDLTWEDPYNEVWGTMLIANNGTHLFVCFDALGDQTDGIDDSSGIAFDSGNDDTATDGMEDQFAIGPAVTNGQMHMVYYSGLGSWDIECSPFDELLPDHAGLAGAWGFGVSDEGSFDHRIYEYSIPLALLGLAPGDPIGFVGASMPAPAVMDASSWWSTWPMYFDSMPGMEYYGTLVTAPPAPNTDITLDGAHGWGEWFVSEVTVTLEAYGAEGVDYTMYRLDSGSWEVYTGPVVISANGYHMFEYYSVDLLGNEEPVRSAEFQIDIDLPDCYLDLDGTAGGGGWYVGDVTVTLQGDDDTSGLNMVYYILDGSWQWYSAPFAVIGDGVHTVDVGVYDNAGNLLEMYFEVWIDTEVPSCSAGVTGDIGEDGWYVSDAAVNITALDGLSGVGDIFVSVDGGAFAAYTGDILLSDGTHTVV